MPKIDIRELDSIDDDYIEYEKIRKTPKKQEHDEQKVESEQKKSKVTDN